MSDEDTQAGNDQQTEETQETGEDQQTPNEVEELRKQLEETQDELRETNAEFTRRFQERSQNDEPQAPADEIVQYDNAGQPVTRQQIEQAKRMFGFDKTEKELAELRRSIEERTVQENISRIDSEFDALEKEYGDKGLKVPKTRAARQEFLNKAAQEGISNPRVAFEHFNRAKIFEAQAKAAPKAPVPDRGENPSQEKDESQYYKALEAARDATGKVPAHKLAELRVKFGKASLTN